MEFVTGIAGFIIGAFIAWEFAQGHATAEMKSLWARSEEKVRYWQGEAKNARIAADQAEELLTAWRDGCQQGREDALTMARSLTGIPHLDSSRSTGVR